MFLEPVSISYEAIKLWSSQTCLVARRVGVGLGTGKVFRRGVARGESRRPGHKPETRMKTKVLTARASPRL